MSWSHPEWKEFEFSGEQTFSFSRLISPWISSMNLSSLASSLPMQRERKSFFDSPFLGLGIVVRPSYQDILPKRVFGLEGLKCPTMGGCGLSKYCSTLQEIYMSLVKGCKWYSNQIHNAMQLIVLENNCCFKNECRSAAFMSLHTCVCINRAPSCDYNLKELGT